MTMKVLLDTSISSFPMHIVDLNVDPGKLKIKNLNVVQYGYLQGRVSGRVGAFYSFYSFTLITKGKGTYQVDNGPIQRVGTGSLYWEFPGRTFNFGPDTEDGWDEYYISFSGSRVQEWIDNGILNLGEVIQVGVDNKFILKIEMIRQFLKSGLPENADRAALLLESLIYEFSCANTNNKSNYRASQQPEFILRILEDIGNTLYQPWNEQEIWKRNHISRSTLRRLVHQNTGYPLNEYVYRLKTHEAKKLLRYTPFQIKEIAQMLGFDDPAYFSRVFRKFTGKSAIQYRNSES